jgi:23S rRNA (cytidine1920-2'-O)/16S rRNA (cytidine1409-2'-O)-methyltransferase
MADKQRIDVYLTENGLAESREKARALIIAGAVTLGGQVVSKPAAIVSEGQQVDVRGGEDFVSRGGQKLLKALEEFRIDLADKVCIDVGASTGGFTDCMLQRGAAYVYAVDVGYGQLAWRLRQDDRVAVMERCNARYLTPDMFDKPASFASADVSFISLKLILPAFMRVLKAPYAIVALIKPQFEAGRDKVGKHGVVREAATHIEVIERVLCTAKGMGFGVCGLTYSPIKGPQGNIEYLAHLSGGGEEGAPDITGVVEAAHAALDR